MDGTNLAANGFFLRFVLEDIPFFIFLGLKIIVPNIYIKIGLIFEL